MAFWPRLTLEWAGWTLTQSSGWSVVAVELGLALALGLELALRRVTVRALREAEMESVADDVADEDADAEVDWIGEADFACEADTDGETVLDGETVPDGETDPEGEGRAGRLTIGLLIGLPVEADVVGVALADGAGPGDGLIVRLGVGVGVGEGDAVLVDGSSRQFWPALAGAAGLAVLREPASAVPDQAARAAIITEPPARKLSVAARTCVKRTDTNLSTLLVTVAVDLYVIRRRLGDGWVRVLISGVRLTYA